jgi:hypothetical protein
MSHKPLLLSEHSSTKIYFALFETLPSRSGSAISNFPTHQLQPLAFHLMHGDKDFPKRLLWRRKIAAESLP